MPLWALLSHAAEGMMGTYKLLAGTLGAKAELAG